jgi:hypothetical protein
MKTTSPTKKQSITVLLRCTRKANDAVIYHIANDDNKEYLVTLANGKSSCTEMDGSQCKGCYRGRKCYHRTQCEAIDAARAEHVEKTGTVASFIFRVPTEKKVESVVDSHVEMPAECPTAAQDVEVTSRYDERLRSTHYNVNGRGVKIDPQTGNFACLCSSKPGFKDNWVVVEDACEHVKIVMSDPGRVERRRNEMAEAQKIEAPGLVQRPRKVDAPRKESAFKKELDALKIHRETPRKRNQGFNLFR